MCLHVCVCVCEMCGVHITNSSCLRYMFMPKIHACTTTGSHCNVTVRPTQHSFCAFGQDLR